MPTRLTTSDLRFIRENLHLSDQALADRIGVTRTWVTLIRKKYGMVKPKRVTPKGGHAMSEEAKRFILERPEWTLKELAQATGYCIQTIWRFNNR